MCTILELVFLLLCIIKNLVIWGEIKTNLSKSIGSGEGWINLDLEDLKNTSYSIEITRKETIKVYTYIWNQKISFWAGIIQIFLFRIRWKFKSEAIWLVLISTSQYLYENLCFKNASQLTKRCNFLYRYKVWLLGVIKLGTY